MKPEPEANNWQRESALPSATLLAAEEAEKSAWWQLEKLTEQAQAAHKRMEDARNKWAHAYGALKSAQRKAANHALSKPHE